ncbi:MAG: hypothetical protein ABIW79_04660 [Gemmatimonas sp.]
MIASNKRARDNAPHFKRYGVASDRARDIATWVVGSAVALRWLTAPLAWHHRTGV